jgi:hypothetical protein
MVAGMRECQLSAVQTSNTRVLSILSCLVTRENENGCLQLILVADLVILNLYPHLYLICRSCSSFYRSKIKLIITFNELSLSVTPLNSLQLPLLTST